MTKVSNPSVKRSYLRFDQGSCTKECHNLDGAVVNDLRSHKSVAASQPEPVSENAKRTEWKGSAQKDAHLSSEVHFSFMGRLSNMD